MMLDELTTLMQLLNDKLKADGCTGCAFIRVEEWEEPCVRCKRNSKDYWRNAYSQVNAPKESDNE